MQVRPKYLSLAVASAVASLPVLLGGCLGGSGGGSTLSGVVVGSYYSNAKVCADLNNNGKCDADEPSTRTDSSGNFSLSSTAAAIVAEIDTDATRYENAGDSSTASPVTSKIVFRAPLGNTGVLSALSTLVAIEMDNGATLDAAKTTVANRLGLNAGKLLNDFNKESDALLKNQLAALAGITTASIQAVVAQSPADLKKAMGDALADKNIDRNVLYVWTQFGAEDTTPFSKLSITGSSSSIALNANPEGSTKVAANTTYTVADTSNGKPYSAGALFARAITKGSTCPNILVDGVSTPMKVRVAKTTQVDSNGQYSTGSKTVPVKADFDVLTCEAKIADGSRWAMVNGQGLKLIKSSSQLNRVLVIGDTGCRIKGPTAYNNGNGGDPLQDCTDDRAWPFKRIALAAASLSPDLVIHNGDIHYREGIPAGVEVPTGIAGSADNTAFLKSKPLPGDTTNTKTLLDSVTYGWEAWKQDFFIPAGPLLQAAPWAITRGNHESCFRAAAGWFHFLDPRPFPATEPKYTATYDPNTCSDYIDPISVTTKDLQVVLLDNSGLQDDPGAGKNPGWTHGDHIRTARQLNAISALPFSQDSSKVTWIVTHKPLFAYAGGAGKATPRTWQYQKAIADSGVANTETYQGGNGKLPANAQMLHAGHIHGWQMISYPAASNLPTSFLNGVGGDTLEAGFMIDSTTNQPLAPQDAKTLSIFGNNITSGNWPWLTQAVKWFGSLAQYLPDAFSSSPIVGAGTAQARISEFGFVVYDRIPGTTNWIGTFYDMDRKKIRTCTTIGKRTSCDG